MKPISRRMLVTSGLAAVAGVAGAVKVGSVAKKYGLIPPDCRGIYGPGETLNYATQRLLGENSLAREFSRGMISKTPFANEIVPLPKEFKLSESQGFGDWRLKVDGMVAHPLELSLADLKSMPKKSQITEVSCEEGWSYVAEWIGTPLYEVLHEAGMLPQARYVVYFSADRLLWDSLDSAEAHHPQTLLAWGMNDGDLPVPFGGPLRIRVPRQLGYKSVKYLTRLTATDSLKSFGKGLGSISPEGGYSWFAGI
jgi:DMSO/TMAO reductase YedYZ molybdopterin-dependent catalytic subunit